MSTDSIKEIITHAASMRVKCIDIKGHGFFVEFFDDGPPVPKGNANDEKETDDEEDEPVVTRPKEYPGSGLVSEEDSKALLNPRWKE